MKSIPPSSFGDNNRGLQIGDNHGSINAVFQSPERPETPPGPLSTVPFPRDPDFVRRDKLLNRIHNKHLIPGSRIALVGLGGVGKSQLAIEYTYQIRCKSPPIWVFWVHASNEVRFKQSFWDFAEELKLPGRRDPGVNIFQLVESWLRDERKGNWICVIDNADQDFLYLIPQARKDGHLSWPAESGDKMRGSTNAFIKPLLEYIPRRPNGFTIITSRSREVALNMVNIKDLIDVKPMERSEALSLFRKKMDRPENSQARQLVEMLEFMPLAIVQATSYIRNRTPRCSVAQYLNNFQSDREATKLLSKEVYHTYRDWEAKNSILETWQISFRYISQTRPSAANLLSLMSFFDRQGIPENLVQHYLMPDKERYHEDKAISSTHGCANIWCDCLDAESSVSQVYFDFELDVDVLRDFSFISVGEDSTSFMMHRLVQLSTRAWLKLYGEEEQWKEKFIAILAKEFPSGVYGTWQQCRILYPHVKCAMIQRPKSQESLSDLSTLLYKGACYALESGFFDDMEKMASKSREQRVELFGPESGAALASTEILAIAFRNQGRWKEAENMEMQIMEIRKIKLGKDHPDTLSSMHNLASTFWNQGRWERAEQLNIQVMETCKTRLGEDHPDTLSSMANLASTYRNQGKCEKAEQLLVQVIETRKTRLGKDHPSTLSSIHNLASTYRSQGRWKEAEYLGVEVMEIRKTKLGEDHPHTLRSMANLALTWKSTGRDAEAIHLLRNCLTRQRERLGSNHPHTLSTYQTVLAWEMEKLNTTSWIRQIVATMFKDQYLLPI